MMPPKTLWFLSTPTIPADCNARIFTFFGGKEAIISLCCWTGAQLKELMSLGYTASLWLSSEFSLGLLDVVPGLQTIYSSTLWGHRVESRSISLMVSKGGKGNPVPMVIRFCFVVCVTGWPAAHGLICYLVSIFAEILHFFCFHLLVSPVFKNLHYLCHVRHSFFLSIYSFSSLLACLSHLWMVSQGSRSQRRNYAPTADV